MTKFNLFIRNLFLSKEMREGLEAYAEEEIEGVAPGQLRMRNNWYYLTYLRVVKLKNFDPQLWELAEQDVDCVRVVAFQVKKNKLLVHGGKTEIKEIESLFEAIALKVSASQPGQMVEFDKFYRVETPEIDLNNVLGKFEHEGQVDDIRKLRIKDMEVRLGSINSCIINTTDYGGVKKVLEQHHDNKVVGMELKLRDQEKTYMYFDVDGQVRIASNSADTDVDVEKMAVDAAMNL